MASIKKFIFCLSFFLFTTLPAWATEQLIIEPDQGRAPLLTMMANAHTSLDLVMYGMTDTPLTTALINAKNNGLRVQILLQQRPYKNPTENNAMIARLRAAKISYQWPSDQYQLTHQKSLVIDNQHAIIMTFNFTHSSFKDQRNFALVIDDPAEIKEIQHVFAADWQHKPVVVNNPHLIWSPDNSRAKISALLSQAHQSILIYAQTLTDYATIGTLAKAAQHGVNVQLLLSAQAENNKKFDYLKRHGVKIHFSKDFVIHAKVIIIDNKQALLGSINLTAASIDKNRELSILSEDPQVIERLVKTFKHDW